MAEVSEYDLEPLREGGDFSLYRGTKRCNQMPVLAVAAASEQPSPQNLRRLEHEYSLADALDPAWAVRPLALNLHKGRMALILEDPGGEPLDRVIEQHKGQPINLTCFLRTAIGLATALGEAHRQGLIHKDLKPANALVDDSGHVWLTGFGIASRLPRERQSPGAPELVAGSLPYMAPEQTGRMNRSIDYRSDLYSLGITLYEMSTGRLPFTASDPMEWVHCQIARQPVSPRERAPDIPLVVSAIIMKLLAKIAEDRYQTASGLKRDLQRCLDALESHGCIDEFPLGEHDTPDRLLIPERLYGRAAEINTLLASFERIVAGGNPELVLVSGYSGVGKSSVVNELHKPLVPPRGLFASGKFDQYKRDIPYSTLAQAFRSLIRPILAKNEEDLGRWRDAFRDVLGPNGQLMVDLVPELKLIIGEQQPVPALPPQDARSRFQLVLRRFLSVFTREHPLALFLDDLQWLDAATLDLMEDLLTHPDTKHLMLIGAYRDNEVNSTHPLMRKLQEIRLAGATVHDIVLAPLTRHDLEDLVADSLNCERGRAAPLAELVEKKTTGNPFFAIQFLSALADESLLTFDYAKGQWSWDLSRIHAKGYTDNVVDLMVGKLSRLPAEAQTALHQLACIGNSVDFSTLRMVYQDSGEDMHDRLWEAVRMGLIFRSEDSYVFLHDRVHEAAYSLIPQELRAEAHLRIGRLMASNTPPDRLEGRIFEIVNQLNRGSHLITSNEEHERLAELNLLAGRRAKISTAYDSALQYLRIGRGFLGKETWNSNHALVFSIEYLLAACELLTADLQGAERRLSMLAERAKDPHDIALVTCLRLTLYNILDQSQRCIDAFIEYQRSRGKDWSAHPTDEEVSREYDRIRTLVKDGRIEALVDLPLNANPDVLDVLDVFSETVMPAMFTDENLLALVLFRMVNLSLEHGNSDAACFAYVSLGMLVGSRFGNYETGFLFGKLGYDVVEKHGLCRYQARVYLRFGNCVMPWRQHVTTGRALVRRAFDAANRIGDLTFAAYSCHHLNTNLLAAGDALDKVQREAEAGLEFASKVPFSLVIDVFTAQIALIRTLRGLKPQFGSFNDEHFDELQFERRLSGNPILALPECRYWIRKLQARFFSEDYPSAIQASLNAERLLWTSRSYIEEAEYHFYSALARAGAYDSAPKGAQQEHRKALADHHRQLAIWAENCPENFQDRAALVAAEIARIEGRDLHSMHLYEQAIHSAHANGFVHNEGIVNELAGRFFLARGIETAGHFYLRSARICYDRWGAIGKVQQLDERYPWLRPEPTAAFSAAISARFQEWDVGTAVKASQALSSEIVVPKLIERLMRLAIEHAGADRGLLIMIRGNGPQMEAEATTDTGRIQVVVREEPVTPSDLPLSALHYVIRTQEAVLLDDASADNLYSMDPYVRQKRAKSILCLPIVKQAKLIGVLYLENSLTPFAFTPDRVTVLQLLASQAAISLENAGLYSDLQRSEAFLAQGQSISQTGSFGWRVIDGEIYWSGEIYKILEYDPSTRPTLERVLQRIHPGDREVVRHSLDRAADGRTDFDIEPRLCMPDGRIKHVHIIGRAVNTGNLDFICAVLDITERTRAEDALRQAQDDLARINRATTMGELAASLAHELSQPISGTMTNADACLLKLERDKPDLDEVHATVTRIARDAQRAAEIIGRIRSVFAKGAPIREVIDLNEINRETVALLHDEAVRHHISVRTQFAADLPRIIGDRVQLQQVLMNLIVNGIDAMKNVDGIREMVIKSQRAENEEILVSVSDTGIGFPPHLAERIFDPFFTTKPHGTGMGLRISRSIIESHNGRLWAASTPGRGATFHLSLPAARAAPQILVGRQC